MLKKLPKTIIIIFFIIPVIYVLSLVSQILLPFMIGLLIAYFLDPAVDKLRKYGISRGLASVSILSIFILAVFVFCITLGPILYHQLISLLATIPSYLAELSSAFSPHLAEIYDKFGYEEVVDNSTLVQKLSAQFLKLSSSLFSNIWHSSLVLINGFVLFFITPIITFYFLRDWDKLVLGIYSLVPKKNQKETKEQFKEIDKTLSAYIRGQTNVCLILGAFYAICLTFVGLNHGFVIGFFAGILAFIPYFGAFLGMAIAVLLAFLQFTSPMEIVSVLLVFVIGQFIEGNFITPKLVGDKVGIHPALIIFSLLAGGVLFGFVGILFAIPAISIIGVITRFYNKKYLASKFFKD
jgi:predicted PurR-regulated permease PerM